jgi:holliday junction DNA helicase RuvA
LADRFLAVRFLAIRFLAIRFLAVRFLANRYAVFMIAHLRGRLLAKHPQQAIIEAGGVGYDVVISVPTFTALPAEGGEVALHIHTHVREDTLALYGFLDAAEKRVFERLITVSGVGPKLAVTILSGLNTGRLVAAIRGQDHATLTLIPGVGKKLAERLVVELKDKLEDMATAPVVAEAGPLAGDVLSALVNLGYQRPLAQKAIASAAGKDKKVTENFDALFRAALAAIRN